VAQAQRIAHAAGVELPRATPKLDAHPAEGRHPRVAHRSGGDGLIGETLLGPTHGRAVPGAQWNLVTLAFAPPLIGLIAATFVPDGQPRRTRRRDATSTGVSAFGTLAMACPGCNPLAIPLFGTARVLSFLAPERGLIALLSIAARRHTPRANARAEQLHAHQELSALLQ
jgi:hypothetical protein